LKLKDIYQFAVDWGIAEDPRGKAKVQAELKNLKREYKELKPSERKYFDQERLKNPYADTRILYGSEDIVAHHPEGRALAGFYDVMHMQADILNKLGVPINVAEGILRERIREVERRVMPVNHNRAVDVARLLDIPLLCVHTPADNGVTRYLQDRLDRLSPQRVGQVLDSVLEIPEYQQAAQNNAPPAVLVGAKKNRCGKVFVDMTGGTGGSKKAFEKLAKTDVGTILGMHIGEEHYKEAEKNHINVVIAGHIASDSLGMNLLLDKLMQQEKMEIVCCSGFHRVERPLKKGRTAG
jgi:hypothetical protein